VNESEYHQLAYSNIRLSELRMASSIYHTIRQDSRHGIASELLNTGGALDLILFQLRADNAE
jgi:hypothetical protein